MVTPRVSKALNPHKRKLSIKQIRAGFGGKRRRAGLKASKRHKHKARASTPKPKKHRKRAAARKNPRTRTKVVYRTKYKTRTKKVYVKAAPRKRRRKATSNPKRRRRSSNPPWLVTMSPVGNPHKRRKSVAAKKHRRKASAHRHSGKRRNPTRRRGVARRGRRTSHRHSNPMVSGHTVKQVIGAAVGFSIAKKVPPMFGPSMNSSPLMSLLSTGITAGIVAWAARKFAPGYADGALIGGGMAVLNVAWNAWAPPSIAGYSALGDFVPGGFPLPQGPVRYALASAPMEAPNGSQVNVGAFGRAW